MRDGYSTGKGLGIGLPGAKRLMDEFEIASEVGKGTTVIFLFAAGCDMPKATAEWQARHSEA